MAIVFRQCVRCRLMTKQLPGQRLNWLNSLSVTGWRVYATNFQFGISDYFFSLFSLYSLISTSGPSKFQRSHSIYFFFESDPYFFLILIFCSWPFCEVLILIFLISSFKLNLSYVVFSTLILNHFIFILFFLTIWCNYIIT